MAISYYAIQRANPQDSSDSKWYPQLYYKGYVDLEEISQNIADLCTVTVHDVKAILSALQQHIADRVANGESVRLGDLGSFHGRTNCYSVEDESENSTDNIYAYRLRYRRSGKMAKKLALSQLTFKKVSNS